MAEPAPTPYAQAGDTFDGVVALPHTEDGGAHRGAAAHNRPMLVRTLTGWLLHPNVGAALVLQAGRRDLAAISPRPAPAPVELTRLLG